MADEVPDGVRVSDVLADEVPDECTNALAKPNRTLFAALPLCIIIRS